jgi:hypothetical protein
LAPPAIVVEELLCEPMEKYWPLTAIWETWIGWLPGFVRETVALAV